MLIERKMFDEYVLPVGHQQSNIMVSREALKGRHHDFAPS